MQKISTRREFLASCAPCTIELHAPIIDLRQSQGFLNPTGLGQAYEFSGKKLGQSTVAFDNQADFRAADASGRSPSYGGAEYGIVQTPEAAAVCEKFCALHGGAGALILPSGLGAVTILFETFLKGDAPAVLLPDNRYYPAERVLNHLRELNPDLKIYKYSPRAGAEEIETVLAQVTEDGRTANMIYLESPGSQTFEIAALDEIIAIARARNIRSAMDNTWASHIRFKPLEAGVDIAVQATTKYESGYADTPSGILVAANEADYKALSKTVRATGMGAVAPTTCMRLFHRVDSTAQRIDQHYDSALKILDWFKAQDFVDDILCPFLPISPDYARFQQYFKKGNGLFTVVFKPEITSTILDIFLDALLLFRTGDSWGGHISLISRAQPSRSISTLPQGAMVRFNIGLEDADDLTRDLAQAAPKLS